MGNFGRDWADRDGTTRHGSTVYLRALASTLALGLIFSLLGPFSAIPASADGLPEDRGSHTKVARENPASNVPFVEGITAPTNNYSYVSGVAEVGNTVVVVGKFPSVRNPGSNTSIPRTNIFAYDKTTGLVRNDFIPVVDDYIDQIAVAPDGQSVFIVGKFTSVNGQPSFGLAKLNVSNGQRDASFTTTTAGRVQDIKVRGNRMFLGGNFTHVGGIAREKIAVVNATTGAVEPFNVAVGEARVGDFSWVASIDVTADGSQMIAAGNFVEIGGQSRSQVALLNVNSNSVAAWYTDGYEAECSSGFWTYMRDVEFSPDASYFVIATTGAAFTGTLCDSAARWENQPTDSDAEETWADWSGGDTLTALAVTDVAIYVGGHNRWMNNYLGRDSAREGAVERLGLSALDPLNGVPLKWNPGRDRGAVVFTLNGTNGGLYLGADTDLVNGQQKGKLVFWPFPVVGGLIPQPTPVNLPVTVFETRSDGSLTTASYNGTTASAPVVVPNTGVNWAQILGATVEAGKVYYTKSNNLLYSRTFDGTTFGPETDLVTGTYTFHENGTYNGPTLVGVTAMFWDNGRLYFTRSGQTNWFYRYLSLESGIIGSQTFTINNQASGFSPSGVTGMEVIGNHLYYTRTDNILRRIQWANGAPVSGTVEVMSGPAIDGRTWNGRDFFATTPGAVNNPPTVTVSAPSNGASVSGTSVGMAANAADSDGSVVKVVFKVDGAIVGTDSSSAGGWTFSWNSTTATNGAHTVTATATDDDGASTTSVVVNITVNNGAPNVPPSVSVTAPSNGATVAGTGVAMSANAADSDGSVVKVDFRVDGAIVGTDSSSAGGWTFSWNSTTAANGAHTVTATATDNQGAATTSSPAASINVNNGAGGPDPAGDEIFFYRIDGVFEYQYLTSAAVLGPPILSGTGYTADWTTITGVDLEGDGQDEMFFYRDDGLFRYYDINPDATLGAPIRAGTGYTTGWNSISAVDLDGDGQDEMFFYRDDGLFRYYNIKPNGDLGSPILAGSGYTSGWTKITAVDLEGDGQDEMFFYRTDGLFRYYDISATGNLGSPIREGSDYTTGWTSITSVNLD